MDQTQTAPDRLFIGVYPCGISYADRHREEHGDYAKLAFLPYETLELKVYDNCSADLRKQIVAHAADIQAKQGQRYQISTAGQTVLLGSKMAKAPLQLTQTGQAAA